MRRISTENGTTGHHTRLRLTSFPDKVTPIKSVALSELAWERGQI